MGTTTSSWQMVNSVSPGLNSDVAGCVNTAAAWYRKLLLYRKYLIFLPVIYVCVYILATNITKVFIQRKDSQMKVFCNINDVKHANI